MRSRIGRARVWNLPSTDFNAAQPEGGKYYLSYKLINDPTAGADVILMAKSASSYRCGCDWFGGID
jgi:hypothetical protein